MNKKLNTLTNFFIWLLAFISGVVAICMLINDKAPWGLICTYWVTLTIKNYIDWFKTRIGD